MPTQLRLGRNRRIQRTVSTGRRARPRIVGPHCRRLPPAYHRKDTLFTSAELSRHEGTYSSTLSDGGRGLDGDPCGSGIRDGRGVKEAPRQARLARASTMTLESLGHVTSMGVDRSEGLADRATVLLITRASALWRGCPRPCRTSPECRSLPRVASMERSRHLRPLPAPPRGPGHRPGGGGSE